MIRMFYAKDADKYQELAKEMFVSRAQLFKERLGWDLNVTDDGREIDEYDGKNPLYVVVADTQNKHLGSLRVMPTTAEHMTADHFSDISGGPIRSPFIWEVTRFCVAESDRVGQSAVRRASLELLLALNELGQYAGIMQYVATFDRRMLSVYRMTGWQPEVVGFRGSGRDRIHVGLWDISDEIIVKLRNRLELGDALCRQDEVLAALHAA